MAEFPLSAGDLRVIANALEEIEFHPTLTRSGVVGRIEVYRPESDDAEVIGYFDREGADDDAWLGFVPKHPEPYLFCPDCGHASHSLYLIAGQRAPSTGCSWPGCDCTG